MRIRLAALAISATTALTAGLLVAPSATASDVTVTEPSKIVWHPTDPNIAYASLVVAPDGFGLGRTISRIDFATNPPTVTDLVTMTDPAHCHANVNALAITPDATTLYAGGYSCVMKIDLANPTAYTSGFIGQDWVQRIVVGSDAAYAVHAEGGAVYKAVKTGATWGSSWAQLVPAQGGNRPVSRGASLTPDGATLYVGDEGGGKLLRKIDTTTGAETTAGTMSPAFTTAVDPKDGAYLLIFNGSNGIQRLQLTPPNAGQTTDATYADSSLRAVSIDADGVFAYVVAGGTRALLKIRTSDLSVVNRFVLPAGASDLAASPIPGNDSVLVPIPSIGKILRFPAAPAAPTSLDATPGNGTASISFTEGQDGLSTITNHQYTLDDSTWTALSPAATSGPITIPGLTNGTAYSIKLRAVNGVGVGAASSAVTVTPRTVPGAPTAAAATAGDAQASLSWTAPTDDGGDPITGYTATADPGGASCTSATTSCSVTGLANGTAYTFTVTATNGAGASIASASTAAVTPRTVPDAPGGVTATGGNTQATVSWSVPGNGGDPITSYTATADPGGASCTTAGTSCTITGLTNGQAYTFTVTATNGVGTGPTSTPSASVTPSAPAPGPGPAPIPLPEPTPTPTPTPSPEPTPTPTPTPNPVPAPEPEPAPSPSDDLKSMDGVTIPAVTSWEGLPPAPVSVSATRQTREGTRVRVTLPSGSAGTSVQATVVTVRDRNDKVAARVVVETPPGQELAVVSVPFVGTGFTVTAYNVNAHGVSIGAFLTSPLVRASTVGTQPGKKFSGTRAGKPIAFAKGSAKLDRGDKAQLRAAAKQLKASLSQVHITGLAGAAERDTTKIRSLSVERARVVAQYLSSQGVRVWIRFDGVGDRFAKGRPSDRRVEIRTITNG